MKVRLAPLEVRLLDRLLLLDAVRQLEEFGTGSGVSAPSQGVRQFNALLQDAKTEFAGRHDIQALTPFVSVDLVDRDVYRDAMKRLRAALELRPPAAIAAFLAEMVMPDNEATALGRDIRELREVATLGLAKTTLLLSGVIAEALLLERHPDKSERGPGLAALVAQAKRQKLFGNDTLSQLDSLVQYRDLIHPRAQIRNRIEPNEARVESALSALRLLWAELKSRDVQFT
ncbi:MAG TPA: hypothetical protein VMZ30_11665 [Pyrinomonadaceae bacterium]|nr:hypothetical protein [Pyrinomonadaceae bacterium]